MTDLPPLYFMARSTAIAVSAATRNRGNIIDGQSNCLGVNFIILRIEAPAAR